MFKFRTEQITTRKERTILSRIGTEQGYFQVSELNFDMEQFLDQY